jgi:hypothetical protein
VGAPRGFLRVSSVRAPRYIGGWVSSRNRWQRGSLQNSCFESKPALESHGPNQHEVDQEWRKNKKEKKQKKEKKEKKKRKRKEKEKRKKKKKHRKAVTSLPRSDPGRGTRC